MKNKDCGKKQRWRQKNNDGGEEQRWWQRTKMAAKNKDGSKKIQYEVRLRFNGSLTYLLIQ